MTAIIMQGFVGIGSYNSFGEVNVRKNGKLKFIYGSMGPRFSHRTRFI
jgi:hypothetical protein